MHTNTLELGLAERADVGEWFLNILTPPWCGDGNRRIAGASLGRRAVASFETDLRDRLLTQLPSFHHTAF